MSNYPGEDPERAEQAREQEQQGDPSEGTEFTAPITPATSGPVFNPSSAQSNPSSYSPPPDEPATPTQPYGQLYGQQYGQQYGQPGYGQAPPQPPYGTPQGYGAPTPGYPPYAFTPPAPNHPQATSSMVLGIIGLVGILVVCGLTLVLSPFAWALGRNAVKEIEASQGRLGGESQARTGMITGIIGTILLVLALVGIALFVILLVIGATADNGSFEDNGGTSTMPASSVVVLERA